MSRNSDAHATPQGPGDARPTALSIITDEGLNGNLKGKVILITGASSGIGKGDLLFLTDPEQQGERMFIGFSKKSSFQSMAEVVTLVNTKIALAPSLSVVK